MAKGKFDKWLEQENLILMQSWARNGLTDEQIAHNMGISPTTLYDWKNKFPQISNTLKEGKEVVDILVENALLKRAMGYKYTEKHKKFEKGILVEEKEVVKEVAPDVTAQIFWLKNRKPNDWRDKREVKNEIEFESDGFIEALKGQAKETFKDCEGVVEE